MLTGLWSDLRHAIRSLAKARAFTVVCVVSLGIGMAPVIAVPYAARLTYATPPGIDTSSLVQLVTTTVGPHQQTEQWSYPDYVDLRGADTGMTVVAWTSRQSEVIFPATGGAPIRAAALHVPANYFKTIGVSLARGAGFAAQEDDPLHAEDVVILSDKFWRIHLAADPDIVGKTLTIDGRPNVVVGVNRDGGHVGFSEWDFYLPLERHPGLRVGANAGKPDESLRDDRAREWLNVLGRRKPGVNVQQASAAVVGVTARLAKQYPKTNEFKAGIAGAFDPIGILMRSQIRRIETLAFVLTGMVLLVISLNISGMMQVRGAMRERELSIRQAIGATRGRLARYLLSESIVLACAGGLLASVVIFNGSRVLPHLVDDPAARDIPPHLLAALNVSVPMVAFCFGLCLFTSLLFGWLPALRFSRPVIISSLKDDAGGGGGLRVGRVHRWTAALQMTIAVPLLVMGGISLDRVRSAAFNALGFDAELLYAAPLKLEVVSGADALFRVRDLSDKLASGSGVASVAVSDGLPLDFRYRMKSVALQVDAGVAPRFIRAQVTRVGDGYLKALGIPLLRGRTFTAEDTAGAEMVTIISKTLADKLFPDDPAAEPIGKRITLGAAGATAAAQQTLTIVGVTADFPTSQMSSERQQLLLPLAQHADVRGGFVGRGSDTDVVPRLMLIARSAPGAHPDALVTAVETVARELDPDFQRTSVVTGSGLRKYSINDFLTQSMVAGTAGSVILFLSALGIYGVVGLMVATRTREVAVRVALGATRRLLLGMILFDVVKIVTPGIVVGLVLTFALIRINGENMGVPLSGVENVAYLVGGAIAVFVAVLASLAPARRAATVSPMVAMRSL